jgi:ADP-ribose pyrophosphatase YjhB (NUDIX family)
MKFCSHCGGNIRQSIPEADNRLRAVCTQCGFIHYQNPNVICGCLPIHQNKVLLCKRAIEPRYGFWTLPAGFMENGETLQEGAERETWEEARATLSNLELYSIFNLPKINQVYIIFRADLVEGIHNVGEESLETQLYEESEIPWNNLAFPTINKTLKHYFNDRKTGNFPIRMEDLIYKKKTQK